MLLQHSTSPYTRIYSRTNKSMAYIRKHIFSLLTLLLILVLSLMPAQEFPQVNVQFADKWVHWVMYGFLTLVMGTEHIMTERHSWKNKCTKTNTTCQNNKSKGTTLWKFLAIATFASIYGGLMELGQAYLTTSRHGDWMDVWANSFGTLCALVLLSGYYLIIYTRNHTNTYTNSDR